MDSLVSCFLKAAVSDIEFIQIGIIDVS